MTTIQEALAKARASTVDSLDGQVLLAHVLGRSRTWLLAHPEEVLSAEQATQFAALIERCRAGEPVAYLTGERAFFGLDFHVSPAVLIPRPETEHLVEAAIEWARLRQPLTVADVGTGSGVIAVSMAVSLKGASIVASDVSWDALAVAKRNVARHAVGGQVCLVQADLVEPLCSPFDMIVANLPYIATEELTILDVARFEPHAALDGGPDGLDAIRSFLGQAAGMLRQRALLLLEIGAEQGQAASALARAVWPDASIDVLRDYAGHDRVLRIELGANW